MRRIAVLDAPSNLGLRPPTATSVPGCAKAPGALRDHGLLTRLHARDAGCLTPPRYDPGDWRPGDGVAHAPEIAAYSRALADRIGAIIDGGEFPVVLGGDCSILIGSGLAMHRLGEAVGGRIGLVFVDGHSDFRHPGNASYVGAAAGEDLALVTGRGQANLAAIESRRPYFRDIDVVVLGIRAQDEYRLDLQAAGIVTRPVPALRAEGAARSAQWARDQLVDCAGYWVHVDVDVLDPAVMPAVDAPDPGGIAFPELELLLAGLVESPHCLGVEITVFDPDYDPDGRYASEITSAVVAGLAPVRASAARPDLVAARRDLANSTAEEVAPPASPLPADPPAPREAADLLRPRESADLSGAAADAVVAPRTADEAAEDSEGAAGSEPAGADDRSGPALAEATAGSELAGVDGRSGPALAEATAGSELAGADGRSGPALAEATAGLELAGVDDRSGPALAEATAGLELAGADGRSAPGLAEATAGKAWAVLDASQNRFDDAADHPEPSVNDLIDDAILADVADSVDSVAAAAAVADATDAAAVDAAGTSDAAATYADADAAEPGGTTEPADIAGNPDIADIDQSADGPHRDDVADDAEGADEPEEDRAADQQASPPSEDDAALADSDQPSWEESGEEDRRLPDGSTADEDVEAEPDRSLLRPGGGRAPDLDRADVRLLSRPLGSAPLLDSEPLPATRPGMLRPRPPMDPPIVGAHHTPGRGFPPGAA